MSMSNRSNSDVLYGLSTNRGREYLPRSVKKANPPGKKSRHSVSSQEQEFSADSTTRIMSSDTNTPLKQPHVGAVTLKSDDRKIDVQTNIQIFRLHRIDSSTEEFTIGR